MQLKTHKYIFALAWEIIKLPNEPNFLPNNINYNDIWRTLWSSAHNTEGGNLFKRHCNLYHLARNLFYLATQARANMPSPSWWWNRFFLNAYKSKVFIKPLQESQDRHKIRFSFNCINKNTTKSLGYVCHPLAWFVTLYPPPPSWWGLSLPRSDTTPTLILRLYIR